MLTRSGILDRPNLSAVHSFQNAPVCAYGPAGFQRIAGKCHSIKMIFRFDPHLFPVASCVIRCKDRTACSDNHGISLILDENVRKRHIDRRRLPLPAKSAVVGMKNSIVRADRKTVFFVFRKMYRKKRIALRRRVLPNPALSAPLSKSVRIAAKKHKKHKEYLPKSVFISIHLWRNSLFASVVPFRGHLNF